MEDVVISHMVNPEETEVNLVCNPILSEVKSPGTIKVEVEWRSGNDLISKETFDWQAKKAAKLSQEHWKLGKTVSTCHL